jgi:hypothetical protein
MAYLNDYVLDLALAYLDTNGSRLDICTTEPTTYTQATSTYTLGNKTSLSIGAPTDATPNGRKVVVAQITDGSVTGSNTASFWAISDVGNSRLIATGSISTPQAVSSGNTFTLAAFDIRLPDAVSA